MPVTIKGSRMNYKDSNGNYVGVDAVTETTTAEQVAAINTAATSAKNTAVAAIQAKGEETIASVPSDYTTLSNDVDDLKSQLTDILYDKSYSINKNKADNGNNYGASILPVFVYPEMRVTVTNSNNNNYSWQCNFLDANDSSIWSSDKQVAQGSTVTYTVPAGAVKMRVYCNGYPLVGTVLASYKLPNSTVKTDAFEAVKTFIRNKTNGERIRAYDTSLWVLGGISSSNGTGSSSTTRMRTSYLDYGVDVVEPLTGYKYIIVAYDSANSNAYVGMWDGTEFKKSATWLTDPVSLFSLGYRNYKYRLVAATASDSTLTVATDSVNIILYCNTDPSLSASGVPADAKVTGELRDNLHDALFDKTYSINISKADNGNSYGTAILPVFIYSGMRVVVTNNNSSNYSWQCNFLDSNGDTIWTTAQQVGQGSTATLTAPTGAMKMRVYCNGYPLVGTVVTKNKIAERDSDEALYRENTLLKLKSAQKVNYVTPNGVTPLSLLHFSDPHAAASSVQNAISYGEFFDTYIDDIICTGDMVSDKYADGFSWWGDIEGSEDILLCIGNHDVSDGESYNSYGITTETAYNTYFDPYIDNWGVVHTGTETYYYKDYSTKKIRLIVLDYLLTGQDATDQQSWFESALSGARTNDYTVVVAVHEPVSKTTYMSCNFTMIGRTSVYSQVSEAFQEAIEDHKEAGGKFACFICGHTHADLVAYNEDYPNQLCIAITCAAITGRDNDQIRSAGRESNAINLVTIDTNTETIKILRVGANVDSYLRPRNSITISYADKSIITQN